MTTPGISRKGVAGFRLGSLSAFVLATLASSAASAADEDLYFSSLPVVASVSRLPQLLSEAPGSVTVIDRDMIRSSGARSVSDLMRLVPGFQVTPHNQDAPRVAYHGLSNEDFAPRVQVLIDGRSQYSPLFNSGVNWNLIPVALEDIERIEVMRGSNAVAYGSNALLGVINIITQHSALAAGWMFSANHGNQSIRDETLRWGGKMGNADVRFTYQQQGDDGLKWMSNSGQWIDPHDSRHARVFDLRADLSLNDRDELQFSLTQAADISQYGRPNDLGDPFRDYSQSSTALNVGWRRTLSPDEEIKLRFSRVEDWGSDRHLIYEDGIPAVENHGGKSITHELDFQHSLQPWQQTRMVWGLDVRDIALRSTDQFFTNNAQKRQIYRIFSNLEWHPVQDWFVNLGAGWESDSISGSNFNPRAGIGYHLTPEHTLRLVASRAHRTPSLNEAAGDSRLVALNTPGIYDRNFLATPGLEAERIDTLEAGYLAEIKSWRASFDLRAFHERIPNRIQVVPRALSEANRDSGETGGGIFPYGRADTALNAEKVRIRGYEYQLRWQPFETTRLMYSHAYVSVYDDLSVPYSSIADDPGNVNNMLRHTTESAPRHSSSAMLMQRLPLGFEASVMYYKVAFMRWTRNSFIRPFEQVDWRLAYPFKIGPTRGEVAYTAQSANNPHDGLRSSRLVNETHWLTIRFDL